MMDLRRIAVVICNRRSEVQAVEWAPRHGVNFDHAPDLTGNSAKGGIGIGSLFLRSRELQCSLFTNNCDVRPRSTLVLRTFCGMNSPSLECSPQTNPSFARVSVSTTGTYSQAFRVVWALLVPVMRMIPPSP
ncbi:hypothetical protein AB1N83_006732 [Pleurotus pulmonarius]